MTDDILVSFGMLIHNGEKYLEKTLNNFTNIKYKNCELIILDNLSTDKTPKIVSKFLKIDSRINYIKDTQRRDGFEASNVILTYAKGRYFKYFSDDDYVDINIINKYENQLKKSLNKILYFNGRYIDPKDNRLNIINRKKIHIYSNQNNKIRDLFFFLLNRNSLCILYGFYEINFLKSLPPMKTFDITSGADVDNLRVVYLLTNYHSSIFYDDSEIIFIRKEPKVQHLKPRSDNEEDEEKWQDPRHGKLFKNDKALYIKYVYLKHDLIVLFKILKIISRSNNNYFYKILTSFLTLISFFIYPLIRIVRKFK